MASEMVEADMGTKAKNDADDCIVMIETPTELALLQEWRNADAAAKDRMVRIISAFKTGLLQLTAEEVEAMPRDEVMAIVAALPPAVLFETGLR